MGRSRKSEKEVVNCERHSIRELNLQRQEENKKHNKAVTEWREKHKSIASEPLGRRLLIDNSAFKKEKGKKVESAAGT